MLLIDLLILTSATITKTKVDPPTNDHKRMMEVYIDNAEVYQRLLEENKYYKEIMPGFDKQGEWKKTRRAKLKKDIHTITGYDIDVFGPRSRVESNRSKIRDYCQMKHFSKPFQFFFPE